MRNVHIYAKRAVESRLSEMQNKVLTFDKYKPFIREIQESAPVALEKIQKDTNLLFTQKIISRTEEFESPQRINSANELKVAADRLERRVKLANALSNMDGRAENPNQTTKEIVSLRRLSQRLDAIINKERRLFDLSDQIINNLVKLELFSKCKVPNPSLSIKCLVYFGTILSSSNLKV